MNKANLLVTAILAALGVQAHAAGERPSACRREEPVKTVKTGKSWSRVQVKLAKASNKPAAVLVAWDLPKPPRPRPTPPTCGVRG